MAYDQRTPDYAHMHGFAMVWLRAIALAWHDPHFKKALLKDPERTLTEYFNYKFPFAEDIRVRELTPEEIEAGYGWPADSQTSSDGAIIPKSWKLPPNQIEFNVPEKPKPMHDEAIALAAYVDGGPVYLFTCC